MSRDLLQAVTILTLALMSPLPKRESRRLNQSAGFVPQAAVAALGLLLGEKRHIMPRNGQDSILSFQNRSNNPTPHPFHPDHSSGSSPGERMAFWVSSIQEPHCLAKMCAGGGGEGKEQGGEREGDTRRELDRV